MFRLLILTLVFALSCQKLDFSSDKIPQSSGNSNRTTAQQVAFLTEIIADEPTVSDYYYRRAVLWLENKNYIRALQDINQVLKLDKSKSKYFFVQAQILEALKNYPEALTAAQTAEKNGLKQVDLYLLLARLYYQTQQPIQTVLYLNKVKTILPKKPEVYYYQGLLSNAIADTLLTIQHMNKAIAVQPTYIEAYKFLFRLKQKYEQPYQALAILKRAMEHPVLRQDAELNQFYGEVLLQLEEKETAMNWYEKAFALDTMRWEAAYSLGKFHLEEKHYELGVSYLEKALKTNATIKGAAYLVGLVYDYHLKDFSKAKQAYEKALAAEPTNTVIADLVKKMDKRIAYEEYKKSPQFVIDLMRKRQDSMQQTVLPPAEILPKE